MEGPANGQCSWIAHRTSQVLLNRQIHRNGPWIETRVIVQFWILSPIFDVLRFFFPKEWAAGILYCTLVVLQESVHVHFISSL